MIIHAQVHTSRGIYAVIETETSSRRRNAKHQRLALRLILTTGTEYISSRGKDVTVIKEAFFQDRDRRYVSNLIDMASAAVGFLGL